MADKRRPADSADADERDDDIFAVRLRVTPDRARALVESGDYDTGDHPRFAPDREGAGQLDLFMTRAQADELRGRGIELEIVSNQSSRARSRIAELGEGDRYEDGKATPRGIGRKIGGRGGGGDRGGDGGSTPGSERGS
jgi:hypothetical protein